MAARSRKLDRVQLISRLEHAWEGFHDSFAGLSDSELVLPGVAGLWSIHDILGHVTTWEEEALKHLPIILKGGKPPRYSVSHGGIDTFNAMHVEEKRSLPLTAVRSELVNVHRRLVSFLQSVPDEEFRRETRFRRRLRLDTYCHYPKHADAIRKWRAQTLG